MLCVRCAARNPTEAKLCQRCSAVLPRAVGSSAPVEDLPSYRNDALEWLAQELDDYLDGQGTADEVEQAVLKLETRLVTLLETLAPCLEAIARQPELCPDPTLILEVQTLAESGVALFNEGLDQLYQFLPEEDDLALEEAMETLAQGNDQICHLGVLLERLLQQLQDT